MLDRHIITGQLVGAMYDFATYCVGDNMELGRFELCITALWWCCRRVEVLYRVHDMMDSGRRRVFAQQELDERLEAISIRV